jgi:hypothetical protein
VFVSPKGLKGVDDCTEAVLFLVRYVLTWLYIKTIFSMNDSFFFSELNAHDLEEDDWYDACDWLCGSD